MKIRTGFVSNSSSASFVVALDKISARDAMMLMAYAHAPNLEGRDWKDSWDIATNFNAGVIQGWTSMDNGDLSEFLEKNGVNTDIFIWESD